VEAVLERGGGCERVEGGTQGEIGCGEGDEVL
jgi:hypothetical protein